MLAVQLPRWREMTSQSPESRSRIGRLVKEKLFEAYSVSDIVTRRREGQYRKCIRN